MINIILIISGMAIALLLFILLIRLRTDRLVKQIWRSLKIHSNGAIFTAEMVADLDEPVQRYFLHAIKPGTLLAEYVELEMIGSFRQKPDADWLFMQASQIISTAPGFIWQAMIGKGLLQFTGADYYYQGKGQTKFFFMGLIPLVDAQNQNVDRSAAGRLGAEFVWLPSALLPNNGVAWQAIAENTIQGNFSINHEPICLTLTIDSDGKLLKLSLPRWRNATADKSWQYRTFRGYAQEEIASEGYTIPAAMSVGWLENGKDWTFFSSTIKRAKFY